MKATVEVFSKAYAKATLHERGCAGSFLPASGNREDIGINAQVCLDYRRNRCPGKSPASGTAFIGRTHGKEFVPPADFRLNLPSWPRHSSIFLVGQFCQTDWATPVCTPTQGDVKPTKLRHLFDLPRPDGKAARQVPQGPYAPGVIEHPPDTVKTFEAVANTQFTTRGSSQADSRQGSDGLSCGRRRH